MLNNCSEVEEMEKPRTPAATQVLNFSPVRFEDAELTVGCLPYGEDGKQVLEQLRASTTALTFSAGTGQTVSWLFP
jgi:hypothetical protein